MASKLANKVFNATKSKPIKMPESTPLGSPGYDNARDDIEKVKKLREGSIEKIPANNNDIANKKYVDDEIDNKIEDGTAQGQMLYWDTSLGKWLKATQMFWDEVNKRLGIGTDSPGAKLHVQGQDIDFFSGTATNTMRIGRDANQNFEFIIGDIDGFWNYQQDSDDNADHRFVFANKALGTGDNDISFETGAFNRLTITRDGEILIPGNVGIGTTSPAFPLELVRSSVANTGISSAFRLLAKTTADMIDGFGGGSIFAIEDDTSGIKNIARIAGVRDGADNSGELKFDVWNAGSVNTAMRIRANGNVSFSGNLLFNTTGKGLNYGTLSVVSNATETTITTQNVYVQVTDFDTNGTSNNTSPDHTNDHITITKAGDYKIECCITANSVAGAGATFEFEIKKNNGASRVGSAHGDRTLAGGGSEAGSITICTMARLEVNDTLELWTKNESNTQNIIIEDASLSALQVGG